MEVHPGPITRIPYNNSNSSIACMLKNVPRDASDVTNTTCTHVTMQYLSGRGATLHYDVRNDVRKSWRERAVPAIAESKGAYRRHPIDPIPEVRHLKFPLAMPSMRKDQRGV